jgi:aminoglycoside/choline kinase family phosphotransferase
MDKRLDLLKDYLNTIFDDFEIKTASDDASFRRYFRVFVGDKTYIAMDAPPEKEQIDGFIKIAKFFKIGDINTPQIYFENHKMQQDGFLILRDFGDITLLKNNSLKLYKLAIDELIKIQHLPKPCFAEALLRRSKASELDKILLSEMSLCKDWFNKDFDYNDIFEFILQNVLTHKSVVVHRDYHSRNIMVNKNSKKTLGIIDFQDAIIGSYVYDIASLLKDAYIDLGDISELQKYYFEKANLTNFEKFIFDFDMIATQRHLKILGIFKRLSIRDGKNGYLKDLPLVKKYLIDISKKYPELQKLQELCKQ